MERGEIVGPLTPDRELQGTRNTKSGRKIVFPRRAYQFQAISPEIAYTKVTVWTGQTELTYLGICT